MYRSDISTRLLVSVMYFCLQQVSTSRLTTWYYRRSSNAIKIKVFINDIQIISNYYAVS